MSMASKTGDIILIRGRSWRSKLARLVLGVHWNHAMMIYYGDRFLELTKEGVKLQYPPTKGHHDWVILRVNSGEFEPLPSVLEDFINHAKFDHVRYVAWWLRIPFFKDLDRSNIWLMLCDEFVQHIYKAHHRYIDMRQIMRDPVVEMEILKKNRLNVIYDYRR